MGLEIKLAYHSPEKVGELFGEYTDMLVEADGSFEEYLKMQDYDGELKHLESKYGLPDGRLYLAYQDGALAGCIGLRRLEGQGCEMKRLYVRPCFRGKHIGDQLVQRIIDDAREIGYRYILLDTLPCLESAIHLYQRFGFYETGSYNDSPVDTTIYMRKDLS